jgi:NADPH2:quinone reductase
MYLWRGEQAMRAWQITRLDELPTLVHLPDPVPQAGEVGIRILAAGLNFADLLMRCRAAIRSSPALPFVPGMELAGVVEALWGPAPTDRPRHPRPGRPVTAGALAERAVVPADRCCILPDAMTMAEAAGFPIAYGTSHLALGHKAGCNPARRCSSPGPRGVSG